MESINIWVKNGVDKSNLLLVDKLKSMLIGFEASNTLIHSAQVIRRYIKEEEDHDVFEVTNTRGQRLGAMSTGERKKALLEYLLGQKPDAIILDNPMDGLDLVGQKRLSSTLAEIAGEVQLINIVSRWRDILPFAKSNYRYENNVLEEINSVAIDHAGYSLGPPLPTPIEQHESTIDLLVSFENVNVEYHGRPILRDISWEIHKQDFWQLVGANGAGKTTLLSMITGDNHKAYGQDIELFGYRKGSGESIWDIKRHIGYYTTNLTHNFSRRQSTLQMVVSGYFDSIGVYQRTTELQLKKAYEWLSLIGIEDQADKPFVELEPAYQRLILIIRAMVKHPPLLILDEPTADLDDQNVTMVVGLINKIIAESQTAVVFVSHREEAGLSAHRVYELIPESNGSIGMQR